MVDAGELRVVATDGHRLAVATHSLSGRDFGKQEVIIPRKTILELAKLLQDTDEPVSIELSASQARFRFDGVLLASKLVDGKFPDYQRVIPTAHPKNLRISRQILGAALQRAAILTSDKFRGVRWVLGDGSLKITCTNTEQEEAQEELELDYKGEALDIGFNVSYLLDVLNNLDTEDIEVALGDANSSALVTVPGRTDFKYVVMPMRI
jgi:DNA polymerase-3 subunit beta